MASEYAIRLKATLDTSSIQSELQKLRTAQQGGAGNGASGQGTGGGSALGGLGNTLAKLNSTMLNLQKSVDLLARQMRAQNAGMRGGEVWSPPVLVRGFQGPQASGGIIATGGAYQQFRDIQRGLYNQANNTIRNSALPSYNRIKAL